MTPPQKIFPYSLHKTIQQPASAKSTAPQLQNMLSLTLLDFYMHEELGLCGCGNPEFTYETIRSSPRFLPSPAFSKSYIRNSNCPACSYWALTWIAALPSCITLYEISVRQTRDLPVVSLFPHPASFGFRLTDRKSVV